MLVSDTKRFVFIHNPKCAGTSVRDMLMHHDTTRNKFWGIQPTPWHDIDRAHVPLDELHAIYPDIDRLLATYYTFVFVRDPYERLVSAYDHVQGQYIVNVGSYARQMNSFIHANLDAVVADTRAHTIHFAPQHRFAYVGDRLKVSQVFRYETLECDVRSLAHRFGLDRPAGAPLLRSNRQRTPGCSPDLLDRTSIRLIERHYSRDFEVFGYKHRDLHREQTVEHVCA